MKYIYFLYINQGNLQVNLAFSDRKKAKEFVKYFKVIYPDVYDKNIMFIPYEINSINPESSGGYCEEYSLKDYEKIMEMMNNK